MPNLAGKIVKMKRHRVEVHVSSGSSSSEESGSSSSEEEERKQICKHQEAHKEQKKMKRGRKNEAQKECQTKQETCASVLYISMVLLLYHCMYRNMYILYS